MDKTKTENKKHNFDNIPNELKEDEMVKEMVDSDIRNYHGR